MEDESVVPIELYEETVGEFNPNTPNTSRQETVRTLQASPFQDLTLNLEVLPITHTMQSTLRIGGSNKVLTRKMPDTKLRPTSKDRPCELYKSQFIFEYYL